MKINLALRNNVPILPYTFASRLDTWCLGQCFCHSLLRVKVAFCLVTLDGKLSLRGEIIIDYSHCSSVHIVTLFLDTFNHCQLFKAFLETLHNGLCGRCLSKLID